MVEGIGALLTYYWAKFTPFECHDFTCQTPPTWLGLAMFASFGLGVILPAVGIVSVVSMHYTSSRTKRNASFASSPVPESPTQLQNELGDENLRIVFELVAFFFLIAASIGLFMLHFAYMGFYGSCHLVGFAIIGVDCSNLFANALIADWSIVTVLSSVGAAVFGVLSSPVVNRFLSRETNHLHIEKIQT